MSKQIVSRSIGMTDNEWEGLKLLAQKRGRQSLSSVIRLAVAEFVNREVSGTYAGNANGAEVSETCGAVHCQPS